MIGYMDDAGDFHSRLACPCVARLDYVLPETKARKFQCDYCEVCVGSG